MSVWGWPDERSFGMLEQNRTILSRVLENPPEHPTAAPSVAGLSRIRGLGSERVILPTMRNRPEQALVRWFAMAGILVMLGSMLGCARGKEVTPDAVEAARRLWQRAGIHNYGLEWTVTGPNNAHYFVTVQGDEVRKLEAVQPDGTRSQLPSNDPRYFSVDGLFLTIAGELALLKTDRPFGQPNGTKIVMRFEPDSTRGYPHWYSRDMMVAAQGMRIDVLRLVPTGSEPEASSPWNR
jgi:hypothetical protein